MPRESAGAGWIYGQEHFRIPIPAGTGQVSSLLSLPVLRGVTLIFIKAVVVVAATGASASRVLNIRRGNATGTVVATTTYVLADGATVGSFKDIPVTAGAAAGAPFIDSDTLTVEWPTAGAVAFTAGELDLVLYTRQRLQQKN